MLKWVFVSQRLVDESWWTMKRNKNVAILSVGDRDIPHSELREILTTQYITNREQLLTN